MIHPQIFMVRGKEVRKEGRVVSESGRKKTRWPFFCRIAFRIFPSQPHSLVKISSVIYIDIGVRID
ncbi:hypothetical protein [Aneurinibacillus migulanus]|uniref:hypothetical protein n=1 Tax=Aneurinibacillus migulanus TaxID=47500 RepID=UPI001F1CD241|nr:hypothetical protein [Aneurinibacillus migulanus]